MPSDRCCLFFTDGSPEKEGRARPENPLEKIPVSCHGRLPYYIYVFYQVSFSASFVQCVLIFAHPCFWGGSVFFFVGRGGEKDPGLPPLRVLRESGGGALRLAHMALGDPHVMALMHSLDHLPSLTSIDVADNRWGLGTPPKCFVTRVVCVQGWVGGGA